MSEQKESADRKTDNVIMSRGSISELFNWQGKKIRVYGTSENPWFHGADLASALNYGNTTRTIRDMVKSKNKRVGYEIFRETSDVSLDRYEKTAIFINESGMYSLIMKSTLKEAEAFQNWVTDEVLPSIRKTGEFQMNAEILRLKSDLENQKLLIDKAESARIEAEERIISIETENAKLRAAVSTSTENEKKWIEAAKIPPPENDKWMYVASSRKYMNESKFKVGGVGEYSGLISRLNTYNSSHTAEDKFFFVWTSPCYNYKAIENMFWAVCEGFRDKQDSSKEIVHLKYDHVINVLTSLINGNKDIVESFTGQYDDFKKSTILDTPVIYPGVDVSTAGDKKIRSTKVEKSDVTKLSVSDIRAKIIGHINFEARRTILDYDFDTHANTKPISIYWKDISGKFTGYTEGLTWWWTQSKSVIKDTKVSLIKRKTGDKTEAAVPPLVEPTELILDT